MTPVAPSERCVCGHPKWDHAMSGTCMLSRCGCKKFRSEYPTNGGHMSNGSSNESIDAKGVVKTALLSAVGLLVIIALSVGGCAGIKAFNRSQARADANNQVQITHILIRKAQQQAKINRAQIAATVAEAQKRYQEAIGIRRAQDEIQKTLTPIYVQHEAIQAQERTARSGRNNTIIYVPAASNGVPIVQTPPTSAGHGSPAGSGR